MSADQGLEAQIAGRLGRPVDFTRFATAVWKVRQGLPLDVAEFGELEGVEILKLAVRIAGEDVPFLVDLDEVTRRKILKRAPRAEPLTLSKRTYEGLQPRPPRPQPSDPNEFKRIAGARVKRRRKNARRAALARAQEQQLQRPAPPADPSAAADVAASPSTSEAPC